MRKLLVIAAVMLGVVLAAGLAWAVLLTLDPDNVARIGGTGQVDVLSPDNDGTLTQLLWVVNTTSYAVTGAQVTWQPAETGTYVVAVQVFPQGSTTPAATGSATVTVDNTTVGTDVTTTVTFSNPVNPEDIYSVRVVIYQTTTS